MKDEKVKKLTRKHINAAMNLSVDNEKNSDPGEPSFQYPKDKEGNDKIFSVSLDRGCAGSKKHPRG